MSVISYPDALKAFRRGVHVNQHAWRCLVVCANKGQLERAWDETIHTLNASSVGVREYKHDTRRIETNNGAFIRFVVAPHLQDAYFMAGSMWTQIIFTFDPPADVQGYLGSILRSPTEIKGELRMDISEL